MKKHLKMLLGLVVAAGLAAASFSPIQAAAAETQTPYSYVHDPLLNTENWGEILRDPTAIYGYVPNPDSKSIGTYASADWSDPEVVEKARQERIDYHESIEDMYQEYLEMKAAGKSVEEMARAMSAERNEVRLDSYDDDLEGLAMVKARNLQVYGDENGPTADYLYEKYGSWQTVLDKAFSANAAMDACLGLYDTYYDTYKTLGQLSYDYSPVVSMLVAANSYDNILSKYDSFSVVYAEVDTSYALYMDADVAVTTNDGVVSRVVTDTENYNYDTEDQVYYTNLYVDDYAREVAELELFDDTVLDYIPYATLDSVEQSGDVVIITMSCDTDSLKGYATEAGAAEIMGGADSINYTYIVDPKDYVLSSMTVEYGYADGSHELLTGALTLNAAEPDESDLYNATHKYERQVTVVNLNTNKTISVNAAKDERVLLYTGGRGAFYSDRECKTAYEPSGDYTDSVLIYYK